MLSRVRVEAPATSANLGPGFDSIGLAFSIYCSVDVEIKGKKLKITGCEKAYQNEDNLVWIGFKKTLEYKNMVVPSGVEITIASDIPVSRGLGSSSACTCCGIFAANALYELKLSNEQMLEIAADIEGHADNAAACIYGGLTAVCKDESGYHVSLYPVSGKLKYLLCIPNYEVSTSKARSILPKSYSKEDIVYTMTRLAALPGAFKTADIRTLGAVLDDKIHEPYRRSLIKNFDEIKACAIDSGAAGFVISGSGSTMLLIHTNTLTPEIFERKLKEKNIELELKVANVSNNGTSCSNLG